MPTQLQDGKLPYEDIHIIYTWLLVWHVNIYMEISWGASCAMQIFKVTFCRVLLLPWFLHLRSYQFSLVLSCPEKHHPSFLCLQAAAWNCNLGPSSSARLLVNIWFSQILVGFGDPQPLRFSDLPNTEVVKPGGFHGWKWPCTKLTWTWRFGWILNISNVFPMLRWIVFQAVQATKVADLSPKNIFGNNPPQMVP